MSIHNKYYYRVKKALFLAVCIIQSQVFISVTFSSFKSPFFEAEKKCANNS